MKFDSTPCWMCFTQVLGCVWVIHLAYRVSKFCLSTPVLRTTGSDFDNTVGSHKDTTLLWGQVFLCLFRCLSLGCLCLFRCLFRCLSVSLSVSWLSLYLASDFGSISHGGSTELVLVPS